jgi:hypothetical protein
MAIRGKSFNESPAGRKTPSDAEKRSVARRNVQKQGHSQKSVQKSTLGPSGAHPLGPQPSTGILAGRARRSLGAATTSLTVVIWTTSLRWLRVSPRATAVPPPAMTSPVMLWRRSA